MPRHESKLLTEVELELMNVLWKLGEATVRDVMADMPKERNIAYTSASTIIRILEQKGVVRSKKDGKAHIYIPKLKKPDYEAKTLHHVIDNVFDGAPSDLVRRLASGRQLSEAEKKEIKRILDEEL